MMQRRPRIRDEAHLAFIRQFPCVICHDNTSTEAAHIRMSDASYGKKNPGIGAKSDDKYALPLCGNHHRAQHAVGDEREFWNALEMDPIKIALALYAVSGDYERGYEIVMNAGRDQVNILAAG